MEEILNILLLHNTGNSEEEPSLNIVPAMLGVGLYLEKFGIHYEIQQYNVSAKNGRQICHCNLIAYKPTDNPNKKYILLQGHIDTVPEKGEYSFEMSRTEVMGRGVVDMKSSLAGMIKAFVKTYDYGVALLITGDEEANGFAGINTFLNRKHIPILFAINGEPNGMTISRKMKGVIMFDLEKQGANGHSSSVKNDFLIEKTIPLLNDIKKYLDKSREVKNKEFGNTVGALTIVRSGTKANQLPEKIQIHFHLRTVEDSTKYSEDFDFRGFDMQKRVYDPIAIDFPPLFVDKLKQVFSRFNFEYSESVFGAFSEASILNKNGIPSIIFGVGSVENSHIDSKKEIALIMDIEMYAELLENFLLSLWV